MASSAKTILLKTRVGVDGEQTYKEALNRINGELRVLKAEMNAATSAFGDNQNSVEALTAKQEALTRQQEMHAEKVQRLTELLELSKTKFAENSEVQNQCRTDLAYAQAALNKCTNELGNVSAALESAKQAEAEAADGTNEAQEAREKEAKALKEITNAIAQYDASLRGLKDVEADAENPMAYEKLDLLHDKMVAQSKQVALLTKAYEEAKEKTGEYSDETTRLYQSLESVRQAQAETRKSFDELDEAITLSEQSSGELARIALEAQKAREQEAEALKHMSNAIAQYDAKLRGLKDAEKDLESPQVAEKLGLLSEKLEAQDWQIELLAEAYQRAKEETGEYSDETTRLLQALESAKQAYAETTDTYVNLQEAIEKAGDSADEITDSVDEAQKAREQEAEALKKATNAIAQYDARLRGLKDAEKDIASNEAAEKMSLLHDKLNAQNKQVALLTKAYDEAKEETGEYSDETTRLYQSLENAKQAQAETSRNIAEMDKACDDAEEATDELAASTDEAAEATEDMGEETEDASGKARAFASVIAGAAKTLGGVVVAGAKAAAAALLAVGSAAAAAVKAGFDLSISAGQYADNIATVSSQMAISQESLQKWSYTSNFIDTSVESIADAMKTMNQSIGQASEGSEEAQKKFQALGVSFLDVNGRMRDSESVFWDSIDALHAIKSPVERNVLAMELFGESARQLNPLIEAGSEAFQAMGDEAQQLGTVFSDEELATMGGFDDTMGKAKQSAEGLKNAIGLALIPAFQPLVSRATSAMAKVNLALRDGISPDEVGELVGSLLDEAEAAMGDVATMIENALPLASSALGKLVSSLGKKLPGMVSRILPSAMGLLQGVLNAITSNASEIGRVAGELVGQLASFLVSNLPGIVSAGWSLVGGLLSGIATSISPLWETVKDDVAREMGKVWGGIKSAFGTLAGILEEVLNLPEGSLTTAVEQAISAVEGFFGDIWGAIQGVFHSLGELVRGVLNGEMDVQAAVDTAALAAAGFFGQIWAAIAGTFLTLGDLVLDALGINIDLESYVEEAKGKAKEFFQKIWDAIASTFLTLGDLVKKVLSGEISLGDALETAKGKVIDFFQKIWDAIAGVFKPLSSLLSRVFGEGGSLFSKVREAWGRVKAEVTSGFKSAWGDIIGSFGNLGDWFGGIWEGVATKISDGWGHFKGGVQEVCTGIWSTITGWFGGGEQEGKGGATHESSSGERTGGGGGHFGTPEDEIGDALLNQALTSVAGNVEGTSPNVSAAMTKVIQAALDAAKAILTSEDGIKTGAEWMDGLEDGFGDAEDRVAGAARDVIKAAEAAMRSLVNSGIFTRIGLAISAGVAMGIRSGTGAIINAARSASRQAYTASKVELDVRSPSHKMQWIGEQSGEGLAVGLERKRNRIAEAARTLSSKAMTEVQTAHGPTPIDYTQLGDATAAALRREGVGESAIDYDRMGAAVAQANKESGIGKATIVVGKQELGRSLEPEVNSATAQRSSKTIAGRPGQLVLA